MDYDDNFDSSIDSRPGRPRSPPTSGMSLSKDSNPEQIAEMVLQKLGHMHKPQQQFRQQGHVAQQSTGGPYVCGKCTGLHPTDKCTSYTPIANQTPTKYWCIVCKWNTMHVTQDCLHIARLVKV